MFLAGRDVALVTDLPAASPVVRACWDVLTSGLDGDAIAELLRRDVAPGSARVALAITDGDDLQLLLGGSGAHAVVAVHGGPPTQLDAAPSAWTQESYRADGVRLSVDPGLAAATDVDGTLPIRVGMSLASVAILGRVQGLPPPTAEYRPQHGAIDPQPRPEPVTAGTDVGGADGASGAGGSDWLAPEAFGVRSEDEFAPTAEEVVAVVEPTGLAPTVLAVSCPAGHLDPPFADTCRVCGAPIPQQGPFSAPRPSLGVLALPSGATIALDRDTVIGRAPTSGAAAPEEAVRLVRVPSPDNDVSRNHVRISLEGWNVLVTDLGSTNGTLVTPPGAEPVQLSPHEAVTIAAGTVISLANEITLRFDPRG